MFVHKCVRAFARRRTKQDSRIYGNLFLKFQNKPAHSCHALPSVPTSASTRSIRDVSAWSPATVWQRSQHMHASQTKNVGKHYLDFKQYMNGQRDERAARDEGKTGL